KYNVKLPSLSVEMRSDIPLARGLGSSASALVGEFTYLNSELDSLLRTKTIMFLKWLSKSHLNIM
ncbi:hypothetical protein EDM27_16670, partial [Staphylococcus aureus]